MNYSKNKSSCMDGLTVRDGRLMNHAPDGVMGIVAAANARKAMKRESKIQMQSEAYERGEMMSEMKKTFMI